MTNTQHFNWLCKNITREGIDDLMDWLKTKSDFYTAPASTKYHGAYEGGLLEHSIDVYEELQKVLTTYPEIKIDKESALICALFHDLCKVHFYTTERRNRKNDAGQWESYDYYTVDERFCYGGHGSKSVFLLQQFIKLHPEEAVAINCHMGVWGLSPGDARSVGDAYEKCPFAWALHVADEAATYLRSRKQKGG